MVHVFKRSKQGCRAESYFQVWAQCLHKQVRSYTGWFLYLTAPHSQYQHFMLICNDHSTAKSLWALLSGTYIHTVTDKV